jgi:hypothetical protein
MSDLIPSPSLSAEGTLSLAGVIAAQASESAHDSVSALTSPIPPLSYNGKPVVTTKVLADFYGCPTSYIHKIRHKNKDRFVEGKDSITLRKADLESFLSSTRSSGIDLGTNFWILSRS